MQLHPLFDKISIYLLNIIQRYCASCEWHHSHVSSFYVLWHKIVAKLEKQEKVALRLGLRKLFFLSYTNFK